MVILGIERDIKMTEKKLTKNISFSSYWARMFKKYIFLLILCFFPVQSFSGSCLDGSDPVKSISIENLEAVFPRVLG